MSITDRRKQSANLLLITFDQWRGDWGNPINPIVDLPSLDRLAMEGWTAQSCYTSSPQCVPARISWITGLFPSQVGITRNEEVNLPEDAPSIIRNLREKGWETGIVGKTHWSNHNKVTNLDWNRGRLKGLGFNKMIEIAGPRALQKVECELTKDWKKHNVYNKHIEDMKKRYENGRTRQSWKVKETTLPTELYPDIWIANKGLKMLEEMPRNKPWMLWISFVGPHEPFDTPKEWKSKDNGKEIPEIIINDGWIERLEENCSLYKIKKMWENKLLTEDLKLLRRDYADNLKLLDDQVKKLLDGVNSREDTNRTAVAVTADHGEMLGDHEILYKSTFLEPSVKVPFIYKPPKGCQGVTYRREIREIGLTKLLKKILENLQQGGEIDPITKWCKKQKGAIVEFENETMFIRNKVKIVFNQNQKAMWCTDLNDDPNEETNALENEEWCKKESRKTRKIYNWAKGMYRKKEKKDWLKLKLNIEE